MSAGDVCPSFVQNSDHGYIQNEPMGRRVGVRRNGRSRNDRTNIQCLPFNDPPDHTRISDPVYPDVTPPRGAFNITAALRSANRSSADRRFRCNYMNTEVNYDAIKTTSRLEDGSLRLQAVSEGFITPDPGGQFFLNSTLMKTTLTSKPTRKTLLLSVIFLVLTCTASAQYSGRPSPRQYIGIESFAGARTFGMRSNAPELNGLSVNLKGFNAGMLGGTEAFIGKLRYGIYKSSQLTRQRVDMQEAGLSTNIFPLYLLKKKSKLVKPYSVIGLEYNQLKLYGNFNLPAPAPPTPSMTPPPGCQCTCPMAPPPPAEAPSEPVAQNDDEPAFLGKLTVSRFNLGGGVIIHVPSQNKFVNLFAEMSYGFPIGTKASVMGLQQTKVSKQLVMNIGLSFGVRSY